MMCFTGEHTIFSTLGHCCHKGNSYFQLKFQTWPIAYSNTFSNLTSINIITDIVWSRVGRFLCVEIINSTIATCIYVYWKEVQLGASPNNQCSIGPWNKFQGYCVFLKYMSHFPCYYINISASHSCSIVAMESYHGRTNT